LVRVGEQLRAVQEDLAQQTHVDQMHWRQEIEKLKSEVRSSSVARCRFLVRKLIDCPLAVQLKRGRARQLPPNWEDMEDIQAIIRSMYAAKPIQSSS
jgi:hypothetical protein